MVYYVWLCLLFVLRREKRLLFLWVCFDEKLCLSIMLYLSATFPRGATVAGRKTVGYAVLYRKAVLGLVEGRLCFYFQVAVERRRRAAPPTCKEKHSVPSTKCKFRTTNTPSLSTFPIKHKLKTDRNPFHRFPQQKRKKVLI